jgi:hypothetical protein
MNDKPDVKIETMSACCGKSRYEEEIFLNTPTGRKIIGTISCCVGDWKGCSQIAGQLKIDRFTIRDFPRSAWDAMVATHPNPPYYFVKTKDGYAPESKVIPTKGVPSKATPAPQAAAKVPEKKAPQERAANDDTFGESFE